MRSLSVVVEVPPSVAARGSTLHVIVRDTSLADALHPTVAQRSIPIDFELSHPVEVKLELPNEVVESGAALSVWAHLDRAGDGDINPGDCITTEHYPVSLTTPVHVTTRPI